MVADRNREFVADPADDDPSGGDSKESPSISLAWLMVVFFEPWIGLASTYCSARIDWFDGDFSYARELPRDFSRPFIRPLQADSPIHGRPKVVEEPKTASLPGNSRRLDTRFIC